MPRTHSTEPPEAPEPLQTAVYDNHTHLEMKAGRDGSGGLGPEEALDAAEHVGVRGVVQVGTDLESSRWSAELADREPRVLAAIALHPNDAPKVKQRGELEAQLAELDALAAQPRVRAIGETGLDYFRTESKAGIKAQHESFEAHIEIAKKHDLTLQIHDRDAHKDIVETLLRVGAPERTVFHCFSSDEVLARLARLHGWYLSFSGTVTFRNGEDVRRGLDVIDEEHILVETDAPFLTPEPYRGRPNSAYMIPYTLRSMAERRGVPVEELAEHVAANTERVYGSWDADLEAPAA